MKKLFFILIALTFVLVGCNTEKSIQKDLQSQTWNFLSSEGNGGQMEFSEDNLIADLGMMKVGMDYKIKGDQITMKLKEKGKEGTYTIERKNKGFIFISNDNGDIAMTLSPKK